MKKERLESCIYCNTKLNKVTKSVRYCIQCDKYFKNFREVFFTETGQMFYVEEQWINTEQ